MNYNLLGNSLNLAGVGLGGKLPKIRKRFAQFSKFVIVV
jgi:hypothetical protein